MAENIRINYEYDFTAFKLIRIAKNMKICDIAEIFEVSPGYIYELEKGRKLSDNILNCKLIKIGVDKDDFKELEMLVEAIKKTNLPSSTQYSLSLLNALGVVDSELKRKSSSLTKNVLKKNKLKICYTRSKEKHLIIQSI